MLHRLLTFLISRLLLSLNVDCRQLVVRWKYTGSLLLRSLAVSDRQLTPLFFLKSAYISSISLHIPWSVFWSGHKAISLHVDTIIAVIKPQPLVPPTRSRRSQAVETVSLADTRLLRGRRRRSRRRETFVSGPFTGLPADPTANPRSSVPEDLPRKTRACPSPVSNYESADENVPCTDHDDFMVSQDKTHSAIQTQWSHLHETAEGVKGERSSLAFHSASRIHHSTWLPDEISSLHCSSTGSPVHHATTSLLGSPATASSFTFSSSSSPSSAVPAGGFLRTLARRVFRAVLPSSLDPFSPVFVSSLLLRLLKRASVHLTNVQICLEDDVTSPGSPFRCGLSFTALHITSTIVSPPNAAPQAIMAVVHERARRSVHGLGTPSLFSSSVPRFRKAENEGTGLTKPNSFRFSTWSSAAPTISPDWDTFRVADSDNIELVSCLSPGPDIHASETAILPYLERCALRGCSAGGEVEDEFVISGLSHNNMDVKKPAEESISDSRRGEGTAVPSFLLSPSLASPERFASVGKECRPAYQLAEEKDAVGAETHQQSALKMPELKHISGTHPKTPAVHAEVTRVSASPRLLPPPDQLESTVFVPSAHTRLLSPSDPSSVAAELVGVSSTAITSDQGSSLLPFKRSASDPELHVTMETLEEAEEESRKPLDGRPSLRVHENLFVDDEECRQEERTPGSPSRLAEKQHVTSRLGARSSPSCSVEKPRISGEGGANSTKQSEVTDEARDQGAHRFIVHEPSFAGTTPRGGFVSLDRWESEPHDLRVDKCTAALQGIERSSIWTSQSTHFSDVFPVREHPRVSVARGTCGMNAHYLSPTGRPSGADDFVSRDGRTQAPEKQQERLLFRQLLEVDGLSVYWSSHQWESVSHSNTGPLTRAFRRQFARGDNTREVEASSSLRECCDRGSRDDSACYSKDFKPASGVVKDGSPGNW